MERHSHKPHSPGSDTQQLPHDKTQSIQSIVDALTLNTKPTAASIDSVVEHLLRIRQVLQESIASKGSLPNLSEGMKFDIETEKEVLAIIDARVTFAKELVTHLKQSQPVIQRVVECLSPKATTRHTGRIHTNYPFINEAIGRLAAMIGKEMDDDYIPSNEREARRRLSLARLKMQNFLESEAMRKYDANQAWGDVYFAGNTIRGRENFPEKVAKLAVVVQQAEQKERLIELGREIYRMYCAVAKYTAAQGPGRLHTNISDQHPGMHAVPAVG